MGGVDFGRGKKLCLDFIWNLLQQPAMRVKTSNECQDLLRTEVN